jgi:hypothetical protein
VYAEQDRNGNGTRDYAQKFISTPGQHDGLYWPVVTPYRRSEPTRPDHREGPKSRICGAGSR